MERLIVRDGRRGDLLATVPSPAAWDDVLVVDMRRSGPEPIPGLPRVKHTPGMADELLTELAPLLAPRTHPLITRSPKSRIRPQATSHELDP